MTEIKSHSMWGNEDTQFFYQLKPEKVLEAVEKHGFKTTGRVLALNSMENRVYEVEAEEVKVEAEGGRQRQEGENFVVIKFYRPGRWNQQQILEEHQFLLELHQEEIPVVCPLIFADQTLFKMEDIGLWYAIFPKKRGRTLDEFSDTELQVLGRLLARMHAVGASKKSEHRLTLNPETYGLNSLEYLLQSQSITPHLCSTYEALVRKICALATPLFAQPQFQMKMQRIHGDCHKGNILWGKEGIFLVDFDDMVFGPPVQDLWMLLPGNDEEAIRQRNVLLTAYEEMNEFDEGSFKLVEPLRALRMIHFSAWIAKRWSDPAFPKNFPIFATQVYWPEQIHFLERQLSLF